MFNWLQKCWLQSCDKQFAEYKKNQKMILDYAVEMTYKQDIFAILDQGYIPVIVDDSQCAKVIRIKDLVEYINKPNIQLDANEVYKKSEGL